MPVGKGINMFLSKAVITHELYPGALVIYINGYPSQLLLKLKLWQWLSPRIGCPIHEFRRNLASYALILSLGYFEKEMKSSQCQHVW